MKLRVFSDLHLDYNRDYDISIPESDAYTLIAGDLGGDFEMASEWLRKNIKKGAFVSGNHDPYRRDMKPLEDIKEYYHDNFPMTGDITYFDNDVGVLSKEIGDNILLVADVMYTDYKLKIDGVNGKQKVDVRTRRNMAVATSYLNDFRFATRNGKYDTMMNGFGPVYNDERLHFIHPEIYRDHFSKTFKKITSIVESNEDKDIVLLTHHCLSRKCIANTYVDNIANASYVSDKDTWIRNHKNIKLVVSGHVHNRFNFKLGNALYITNPLGYIRRYECLNETYGMLGPWSSECIIDTETWSMKYNQVDGGCFRATESNIR